MKSEYKVISLNIRILVTLFEANIPFLYSLKTSENQSFTDFLGL